MFILLYPRCSVGLLNHLKKGSCPIWSSVKCGIPPFPPFLVDCPTQLNCPPPFFPLKHCNGFQRLSSLTLCLSSSNWVSLFVKKIWLFNMILFRFTKIVIKMLNRIAVISTSFGCVCSGMKRRKTCKMLYIHQHSSMMHWIFLSLVNIADIAQTFSPAVRRALCMVALKEAG